MLSTDSAADHITRMRAHLDRFGTQVATFFHTVAIACGFALVDSLPYDGYLGRHMNHFLHLYYSHMERLGRRGGMWGPPTFMEFDNMAERLFWKEAYENAPPSQEWRKYSRMWERDMKGRLIRIYYDERGVRLSEDSLDRDMFYDPTTSHP